MEFVAALWLPILITTIVLWFASFLAWAILPHHFGDHKKAACEDELAALLKEMPPGNYLFPFAASSKEQGTKEFVQRYTDGPRGQLNIYRMPNMGKNMLMTILYFLVTVFTIAYITSVACENGAPFSRVFRISGTIGVLTYASSGVLNRIWFTARQWTNMLDGLVYGLILGLIFALMWPGASA